MNCCNSTIFANIFIKMFNLETVGLFLAIFRKVVVILLF